MQITRHSYCLRSLAVIAFLLTTAQATDFPAKVTRIVDGDSLHVLRNAQDITIRLEGIDCPELGQPFGRHAKQAAGDRECNNANVDRPSIRARLAVQQSSEDYFNMRGAGNMALASVR